MNVISYSVCDSTVVVVVVGGGAGGAVATTISSSTTQISLRIFCIVFLYLKFSVSLQFYCT